MKTGSAPTPWACQLERRQAHEDAGDARLQLVEALLVGFECTGEVLEEVARVALGVFHGLEHDDPPLQRNGQGGEFEVSPEPTAIVPRCQGTTPSACRLRRPCRQAACRVRSATWTKAAVSGRKRLADGVHCRVQSQRDTELALVEQDGGCLVDRVAAAVKFAALVIKLLFVQLLEQFCDVLDGLLALVLGRRAHAHRNGHEHERRGNGECRTVPRFRGRCGSESETQQHADDFNCTKRDRDDPLDQVEYVARLALQAPRLHRCEWPSSRAATRDELMRSDRQETGAAASDATRLAAQRGDMADRGGLGSEGGGATIRARGSGDHARAVRASRTCA